MNVLDNLWMSRGLRTCRFVRRSSRSPRAHRRGPFARRCNHARCGFAAPRIAVAALNPHAGEGGLFGREEIGSSRRPSQKRRSGHRVQRAVSRGHGVLKAFGGEFDGVLTMYHDQGQIATKLRGFNRGVTVTGGLSTVFATPAHGTAFDIVGKGVATTDALKQAIRLCSRLAASRRSSTANREL